MKRSKIFGLLLGPVLFASVLLFYHPAGLSDQANAVLACTVWIAVWWILETIPIAITSLLPVILFPLTGALSIEATTASFGHRYIFLYIGGFILAIAIERWNLHKRIALNIINLIGTNIKRIILGFMVATAFLSMWITNTATAVMMLPVGMAIVAQLSDNPQTDQNENLLFGKALMLAIAYSASIGGIATLIGTPPNLILAGIVHELYGIEITFLQWFVFGLPLSVFLLLVCWRYLTKYAFAFHQKEFPGGRAEIKRQLVSIGKITYEEKVLLVVFLGTAFAWISRSFLINRLFPVVDDTMIAMIAGVILFLIPAGKSKKRALINWKEAVKLPWGVILLFGGGLALAEGFTSSGLAEWIGQQLSLMEGFSLLVLLLLLTAMVNFLTEITSNLATTAMLLPVLAPMALAIGVHPYILMAAATIAASCAFMLPVATPPNAVVFGSGYLKIPDMARAGVWMNIFSIFVITIMVYYLLPLLWDFDPFVFPADFR